MNNLPVDVFHLKGKLFYELVRSECGDEVMELFRIQGVSSAHSLLYLEADIFDVLRLDTVDPISTALKHRIALLLSDGTCRIKIGIQDRVDNFTEALRARLTDSESTVSSSSNDIVISADILQNFPWIKSKGVTPDLGFLGLKIPKGFFETFLDFLD